MALGCWQEAVHSYHCAVQAAPHLLENHYGLGSAYGRLGEYGLAIESYEQAFKLTPVGDGFGRETAEVCTERPAATSLNLEPEPFQDRLRTDAEGFDFSALLSSPAARRKAARREQSESSLADGAETAPPSGTPSPARHFRGRGERG